MHQTTIMRYQASTPNAKYLGSNLLGFTDNLRVEIIQPILEKFNVKEIVPEAWMSAQLQLDILREIEAQCSWEELVAVGMKAAEFVPLPPEMNTIEGFLELSPKLQRMVTLDAAPEEKLVLEKLGVNHYRIIHQLPGPPVLLYGYEYGLIKRVKKSHEHPVIKIIDYGTPFLFEYRW